MVKRITWPHELMYTSGGEPAAYEHLSMLLFMSGYVAVLATVNSRVKEVILKHLRELMADASTYVWEPV